MSNDDALYQVRRDYLRRFFARLLHALPGSVTEATKLPLGVFGLARTRIIFWACRRFAFFLSTEETRAIKTVGDLLAFITKKSKRKWL